MKNAKIIELLSSFTPKEIKDFSDHLEKEYLKKDPAQKKLFTYLEKYYPDFPDKDVARKKVFKKLFPADAYQENKLSKVMTFLLKDIESFIIKNNLHEDTLSETLILLKYYEKRNLDKFFESTSRQFLEDMENVPEGTRKYHLKYDFEILNATYHFKHDNRSGSFQSIYNVLSDYAATESLRWKSLSKANMVIPLNEPVPDSLLFFIHKSVSCLLEEDNESLFEEIINLLSKEIEKIDFEESREILAILLDYAIKKVNTGNVTYYEHLFTIQNLHIQKKLILSEDGKILIAKYKNYITVALKLGKIQEAEAFLEKYKDHLPEYSKEETYQFNKANILFEKGNYDDILQLLNTAKFEDIFYNLNQRRLFIKTYYELLQKDNSYFDIFYSNLNAYKKFIYTENTVPDVYIDANKNFLKLIQKISGLSKNEDKKIIQLSAELKATQKLAEREWLQKILQEI